MLCIEQRFSAEKLSHHHLAQKAERRQAQMMTAGSMLLTLISSEALRSTLSAQTSWLTLANLRIKFKW